MLSRWPNLGVVKYVCLTLTSLFLTQVRYLRSQFFFLSYLFDFFFMKVSQGSQALVDRKEMLLIHTNCNIETIEKQS